MKFLIGSAFVIIFSSQIFAQTKLSSKFVDDYVSIQESLAADSFSNASKAIASLAKDQEATDPKLKPIIAKLQSAKDLKSTREIFKDLSEVVAAQKSEKYQAVMCPMAKAKWLQKKGDIKNPYYGKDMLDCGEIIK